jgi:hypothetical protein
MLLLLLLWLLLLLCLMALLVHSPLLHLLTTAVSCRM